MTNFGLEFKREAGWIFARGVGGEVIAEVTFPIREDGLAVVDHTFVDDSLRGQGVAGQLMEECYAALKKDGVKAVLTCPYAVKWFSERPEKNDVVAPLA